jgi:hypothetical protein
VQENDPHKELCQCNVARKPFRASLLLVQAEQVLSSIRQVSAGIAVETSNHTNKQDSHDSKDDMLIRLFVLSIETLATEH